MRMLVAGAMTLLLFAAAGAKGDDVFLSIEPAGFAAMPAAGSTALVGMVSFDESTVAAGSNSDLTNLPTARAATGPYPTGLLQLITLPANASDDASLSTDQGGADSVVTGFEAFDNAIPHVAVADFIDEVDRLLAATLQISVLGFNSANVLASVAEVEAYHSANELSDATTNARRAGLANVSANHSTDSGHTITGNTFFSTAKEEDDDDTALALLIKLAKVVGAVTIVLLVAGAAGFVLLRRYRQRMAHERAEKWGARAVPAEPLRPRS